MRADKKRMSGFYWISFEGQDIVAEYTSTGLGCSPEGAHWHVPQSEACFVDKQIDKLLSGRLQFTSSQRAGTPGQHETKEGSKQ